MVDCVNLYWDTNPTDHVRCVDFEGENKILFTRLKSALKSILISSISVNIFLSFSPDFKFRMILLFRTKLYNLSFNANINCKIVAHFRNYIPLVISDFCHALMPRNVIYIVHLWLFPVAKNVFHVCMFSLPYVFIHLKLLFQESEILNVLPAKNVSHKIAAPC